VRYRTAVIDSCATGLIRVQTYVIVTDCNLGFVLENQC
jgi:hypothetical protein